MEFATGIDLYKNYALVSYRWYLIQKLDDSDLGYIILRRVLKAEYNELVKEKKENVRSTQVKSISGGVDIIVKLDKPSYSFKGGESRAHSYEFGYRGENNQIRRMDKESADGRGRLGRNRSGDSPGSGAYQSRTDLEVSQEELSEYIEFVSEVSTHMGEMLLGSEAFIDNIVAKDGNIAQKAAEKAGDAKLIRYITTGEWDEEEAQFNRKDIKSNNGRKEYQTTRNEKQTTRNEKQTTRNEKQTTKESVLEHSEGSRWGDISYTVERGGVRVLSEIVRGGEKELQKIKAFAKSFYTKRRL